MKELEELAGRVEALTGPDREVDRAITAALNPGKELQWPDLYQATAKHWRKVYVPRYTALFDAAMTLVWREPEFDNQTWLVDASKTGFCEAFVWTDKGKFKGRATTAVAALTAAALRARSKDASHE